MAIITFWYEDFIKHFDEGATLAMQISKTFRMTSLAY